MVDMAAQGDRIEIGDKVSWRGTNKVFKGIVTNIIYVAALDDNPKKSVHIGYTSAKKEYDNQRPTTDNAGKANELD